MVGQRVSESKSSLVTVVVPTRNSAATLLATLESVKRQTYEPIELIVVDNGSGDATCRIAVELADKLFTKGPERSAQRNFGAANSAGDFVLMLDSDMVLEQNVVAACIDVLARTGASAVVIPERTVGQGFWTSVRALERSCYVGDADIEAARFFTRAAFERYGGYDEQLSAGEDWDLPARMRAGGETVARADGVWVLHDEGRLRLVSHLRKKFYYGQTLTIYARRHPTLSRRQFMLIRPAFVRHRRRLARHPLQAAAMLALKWAELAAGGAGALWGARRHSVRRSDL
jgi:glycosyltransferase involved in cell wall biosynthesis